MYGVRRMFVGHGFTGGGKTRFWCHSERSEESLFDLSPMHREILRFAQNDKRTFSAACEAVPYKESRFIQQAELCAALRLRLARLVDDSHSAHLFRIILAIEQFPFFASFEDFFFLRADFFPNFGVHRFFFL